MTADAASPSGNGTLHDASAGVNHVGLQHEADPDRYTILRLSEWGCDRVRYDDDIVLSIRNPLVIRLVRNEIGIYQGFNGWDQMHRKNMVLHLIQWLPSK